MAAFDSGVQGGAPLAEQRYRYLRELGGRSLPTFAALMPSLVDGRPGSALVIVERLFRGSISDEHAAELVGEAKRVAALQHPNLVRIRDLAACEDDFVVASEYVDGERLSELRGAKPIAVVTRVLVDALTGLGALHGLRDGNNQPLRLAHGEVAASNILIGTDGVARVLRACRVRLGGGTARARADLGYFAPEILTGGAADPRADVYSVGVLLWEALTGSAPFGGSDDVAEIVARVMSGRVPRARVASDEQWAEPLADVAARAMAALPDQRYGSASAMAADIRRIAGPKLASAGRVSTFLKGVAGDAIAARRARLEGTPPPQAAASPGLFWPSAGSPTAKAAPRPAPAQASPPNTGTTKPPVVAKPLTLPSRTPTMRPGPGMSLPGAPGAARAPAPIPLVPPAPRAAPPLPTTAAQNQAETRRPDDAPPPSASDVLSALDLSLADLAADSEPETMRRPPVRPPAPTPPPITPSDPISAVELDVDPDSVRKPPGPPPRRPPPPGRAAPAMAEASGGGGAPAPVPAEKSLPSIFGNAAFATASGTASAPAASLPPMRAPALTEPSMHSQERGKRRRGIVVTVFAILVVAGGVAAWRLTQPTVDPRSPVATTASPVKSAPTATTSVVVQEEATAPTAAASSETPTASSSVAAAETVRTTATAVPEPSPPVTTAKPPATSVAPPATIAVPPVTTTAAPPVTTTAPPPATTTARPPATTTAPVPTKPPPKTFDPTVI